MLFTGCRNWYFLSGRLFSLVLMALWGREMKMCNTSRGVVFRRRVVLQFHPLLLLTSAEPIPSCATIRPSVLDVAYEHVLPLTITIRPRVLDVAYEHTDLDEEDFNDQNSTSSSDGERNPRQARAKEVREELLLLQASESIYVCMHQRFILAQAGMTLMQGRRYLRLHAPAIHSRPSRNDLDAR